MLEAMQVEPVAFPAELRSVTPPPFVQTEQTTPRSEAGKRMAKEQLKRPKPTDKWKPTAKEVREFVRVERICVKCWNLGHLFENCPKGVDGDIFNPMEVLAHPGFQIYLDGWQMCRKRDGEPWVMEGHKVAKDVVIPLYCLDCSKKGHRRGDVVCNKQK
jgi:hypothetical protein